MSQTAKEYIKIIVGSILIAIGIYYFWAPSQIAGGGVSGLAIVIQAILRDVPISTIILVLNMILFIISFIILGTEFGVKSIVSSLVMVVATRFFEIITPDMPSLSEDMLLILVIGTLFMALGQAIIFAQEASSGGTDIIAKIMSKYLHLNIAISLFIADTLIVILAIRFLGIEKGLYAALGVFINSLLIDQFIAGFNIEKYVMIIPTSSSKVAMINQYILEELGRGATIYHAEGAYSGKGKTVIATAVDRRQFVKIKLYVQSVDQEAFLTVQNLQEVFGEGFTREANEANG